MTVADPARADLRPSLPGYWRVVWAVLVGYVTAAILLVALGLVLWFAGLVGSGPATGADASGVLGWPYDGDGWWNTLANATAAAVVVGVAVVCVAGAVEWWTSMRVSRGWATGAVLLTGYVPMASFPGLFPGNGVVALLVTALVVQRVALDRPPRSRRLSARRRRHVVTAAAAAALVALGATAGYGVLHPLWFDAAVSGEPRPGDPQGVLFRDEDGGRAAYTFSLDNSGFADVTLTGVEAPGELLRLVGFRVDGEPPFADVPEVRAGPARLPGRDARFVTLVFVRVCPPGFQGRESVRRVTVRYRILGTEQRQAVPLEPAPVVRCG